MYVVNTLRHYLVVVNKLIQFSQINYFSVSHYINVKLIYGLA